MTLHDVKMKTANVIHKYGDFNQDLSQELYSVGKTLNGHFGPSIRTAESKAHCRHYFLVWPCTLTTNLYQDHAYVKEDVTIT